MFRIIGKIYNFVMGLIGLLVLGAIGFLYLAVKWEDYKEQEYAEDRAELIESVRQDARKRGLGDLDQLRREYLEHCPADDLLVLEGNAADICAAMADALLEQSRTKEMTLSDQVELGFQLCALDVERDGDDPDYYCEREDVIYESVSDALAMGLCAFDRSWVFDTRNESSMTKRGPTVYAYHDPHVDCKDRQFVDSYYEGFFDAAPEDDDWPPILDRVYDALESENHADAIALLDGHEFGADEYTDLWILGMFLEDRYIALLPEVLERNGGRVNFDISYYDQPLSRAIEAQSSITALALLDAGADPVRPQEYGVTPIVDAASYGMLDVVKALVARGADVDGVVGSESLDFGEPLRWASWNGHDETALWLLQNGAQVAPEDPTRYPQWSAETLLEYAVVGGDLAVVRAIVQRGAKSEDALRLFENAVAGGSPDVLLLLLNQGYELPDAKHHERIYDNVVEAIKEEGDRRIEDGVRMFEILLGQGLDMSHLSESGWNYGHQAVIHYAPRTIAFGDGGDRDTLVHEQRLRFVQRVIDEVLGSGVDIDQRYESETMLMKAADGGQPELTRYLLEHGADATLVNDEGQTALDIAVREGRRLTAFWDEDERVRRRFSEVVEILGGSSDMLDPVEEPEAESQSARR